MELESIVQELSLKRTPREGQASVISACANKDTSALNVKLPTGYGKTFTAYAGYNLLRKQQRVDRCLFIVPTEAQLDQLIDNCGDSNDRRGDYTNAGLKGLAQICDIRYFGCNAISFSSAGTHEVFATTIQALVNDKAKAIIGSLLSSHQWMIVIDEYHHYGIDKKWGAHVLALPSAFRLAMSATPDRPYDDGALGEVDIEVDYVKAVNERAVKPLIGHGYIYRVDAIGPDGSVVSYTTTDLATDAVEHSGSASSASIDGMMVSRKMRWSPKYISPLVSHPIERMLVERVRTGLHLRAIAGAMSVSHAELVCAQIKSMFPEITAEWVGTGPNGRDTEKNKSIISRFLQEPMDDEGAMRHDTVDVLVHVGMAGEGLDSVLVSEVIHLNTASFNNSNKQENGRAARYISDKNGDPVVGHINFDTSSDFVIYTGGRMNNSMDDPLPIEHEEDQDGDGGSSELGELPEEPAIQIIECELKNIDHGDIGPARMREVMKRLKYGDVPDDDPGLMEAAMYQYKNMRSVEADAFNQRSTTSQLAESVNGAISAVVGRAIRVTAGDGRVERSLAGDLKKRVNQRKKKSLGAINKTSDDSLRLHYAWLRGLEQEIIRDKALPEWMA